MKVTANAEPVRRQQGNEWEVIVPVKFSGNSATIELIYDW
jgi:hypothetical protein